MCGSALDRRVTECGVVGLRVRVEVRIRVRVRVIVCGAVGGETCMVLRKT